MPKITTPWGPATLVEELSLPQEADGREFAVGALEELNERGELAAVRFLRE